MFLFTVTRLPFWVLYVPIPQYGGLLYQLHDSCIGFGAIPRGMATHRIPQPGQFISTSLAKSTCLYHSSDHFLSFIQLTQVFWDRIYRRTSIRKSIRSQDQYHKRGIIGFFGQFKVFLSLFKSFRIILGLLKPL